jgi:hypothetical protein
MIEDNMFDLVVILEFLINTLARLQKQCSRLSLSTVSEAHLLPYVEVSPMPCTSINDSEVILLE